MERERDGYAPRLTAGSGWRRTKPAWLTGLKFFVVLALQKVAGSSSAVCAFCWRARMHDLNVCRKG